MSEYPQPTPQAIFNPSDYPQVFPNTGLDFPNAQGAETWNETGSALTISGSNLTYNGTSISWANITTKIQAIEAISQASNSTTLNVNNSISIQNGETTLPPTQTVVISSDATGNRIAINGLYGSAGEVIVSGGSAGSISWGTNTPTTPTLEEVLTSAVGANDAGNNSITNLATLQITDGGGSGNFVELACVGTSLSLSTASVVGTKMFSGTYLPITIEGASRFIQLFQDLPP